MIVEVKVQVNTDTHAVNVISKLNGVDLPIEVLCQGIAILLRVGHQNGDTALQTSEKLKNIKQLIYGETLNKYESGDISQTQMPDAPL